MGRQRHHSHDPRDDTRWRRWLPSPAVDFDRLTITLLALRDDAPGLTQSKRTRRRTRSGRPRRPAPGPGTCWLLARCSTAPHRSGALSILSAGVEEGRALKERDPAVQAGKYRIIALPWMVPAGATFSANTFPRSTSEAAGT
jgi:uncharacterized protein